MLFGFAFEIQSNLAIFYLSSFPVGFFFFCCCCCFFISILFSLSLPFDYHANNIYQHSKSLTTQIPNPQFHNLSYQHRSFIRTRFLVSSISKLLSTIHFKAYSPIFHLGFIRPNFPNSSSPPPLQFYRLRNGKKSITNLHHRTKLKGTKIPLDDPKRILARFRCHNCLHCHKSNG